MPEVKDEILINRMYVGEYIKYNLGHEIINLVKADNGNHYIYVQPYGTIDKKHENTINTVLLVRNSGMPHTLEIIGKATELEFIKNHDEEVENITYNGVYIKDIFKENTGDKKQNVIFVTFKAKRVQRSKEPIYISFAKDESEKNKIINNVNITFLNIENNEWLNAENSISQPKQTQKMYIQQGTKKAYSQLDELIKDSNLWIDAIETPASIIEKYGNDMDSFIDIIDKQYAEVTYSNFFQYIFEKDKELLVKFAEDILDISDLSVNAKSKREENNIDLLIKDDKYVIVIENKIRSDLNGIKYNDDDKTLIVSTQLNKYAEYVEKEYRGKNIKYYIFEPNYNNINDDLLKFSIAIDEDNEQKVIDIEYKKIKYSKIYKFYKENDKDFKYYDDFVCALEKHSDLKDMILEKQMYKRFAHKIKS